jgi:hypothetical protein
MAKAIYEYGAWPPCDICGTDSEWLTRRDLAFCANCYGNLRVKTNVPFKDLTTLVRDLRAHATNYALDNGALVRDLMAAANYLEAVAND